LIFHVHTVGEIAQPAELCARLVIVLDLSIEM